MTLPVSTTAFLGQAFSQITSQAAGTKAQAQDALAQLQAGPVTTAQIFNLVDIFNDAIGRFNRFKNVTGLNAYATDQVPGYAGTMTTDVATTITATQACIDWVVANFPKDSTNTWLLAFQMGADGTRTSRTFSTAQTAGLQTRLQTLIASIG